jgi:hypothetical protein
MGEGVLDLMGKLDCDLCLAYAAETVEGHAWAVARAKEPLAEVGELIVAAHKLGIEWEQDGPDRLASFKN